MSHYSNGYQVSILIDGKIVETRHDSVVSVPFGSDYVIRLINQNDRRAVARVSIDGQHVTGDGIIVNPHGTTNLERPVDKAVTFRFASTDSNAAYDHGKGGPDTDGTKGLITVEWRPERYIPPYGTGYYGATARKLKDCLPRKRLPDVAYNSSLHKYSLESGASGQSTTSGGIVFPDEAVGRKSLDSGVTVEGDYSRQNFRIVPFDIDYNVHPTLVSLKLMGYTANEGIPRTGVVHCPACQTKTHEKTDKYCRQCGVEF